VDNARNIFHAALRILLKNSPIHPPTSTYITLSKICCFNFINIDLSNPLDLLRFAGTIASVQIYAVFYSACALGIQNIFIRVECAPSDLSCQVEYSPRSLQHHVCGNKIQPKNRTCVVEIFINMYLNLCSGLCHLFLLLMVMSSCVTPIV
jgi:hypothetical protein